MILYKENLKHFGCWHLKALKDLHLSSTMPPTSADFLTVGGYDDEMIPAFLPSEDVAGYV